MRISRKKRPDKPIIPQYNKNQHIKAEFLMVLDENNQNLGEMKTEDALKMAQEKDLDLVEINPKSNPPVAKLIDFAEFKYQKEKQARKQKINSHTSEMKGVRLSVRISEHDMEIKAKQAIKFLDRGDKVKIELMMRGRENAKQDIARDTITRFIAKIGETVEIREEQAATRQGKKFTAVIAKK